jgi:hypothetical protein
MPEPTPESPANESPAPLLKSLGMVNPKLFEPTPELPLENALPRSAMLLASPLELITTP